MAGPAHCQFIFDTSDDTLDLSRAHCCVRETWGGTNYCFWHAGSEEIKSQKELRSQPEVSDEADDILLDRCRLPRETIPSDVSIRGWFLRGSDLRECELSGVDMTDTRLMHSCLTNTNLNQSTLRGADLSGADLQSASLRGADLRGAKLFKTNLVDVDLRNADLRGAQLVRCDLSEATLKNADISYGMIISSTINRATFDGTTLAKTEVHETTPSALIVRNRLLTFDSWPVEKVQNAIDLIRQRRIERRERNRPRTTASNPSSLDEKPKLDADETSKSVAVLLCGLPRTFRKTASNVREQLIEPNNDWTFDFFLNTSHQQTSSKNQNLDAKYNDQFSTVDELLSDLRAAYDQQIVDITLLESESEKFPQFLFNDDKQNFYSYRCYRALKTCLEYAERTDADYDLFICARFDITFTRPIDLDKFWTNRQLSFIPSVSVRPGHFHVRDIDFCCLGDRDSITEWTRYWTYRPDIIPYFDWSPEPTARPDSVRGAWDWSQFEKERSPHAYRLAAHCAQNNISIDFETAESRGILAKLRR